jgi:xanthine dehydrogenase accessory factor
MIARYLNDVLPTLLAWRSAGHAAALATLVNVDGSAPRPRGSQMAIRADGEAVGNLTGGCAEAAIIAEAQARLAAGTNRLLRYGKGSPYIDIQLPCGSGIDVFFDVTLPLADLTLIVDANATRRPATLIFHLDTLLARAQLAPDSSDTAHRWARLCEPPLRIVACGKGPLVPLIAQLGSVAEFEVAVFSSEAQTLELARPYATSTLALTTPAAFQCGELDRWTAFVSLFHEHDWDPPILAQALASKCFYIGALGSQRTAAARRESLLALGLDAAAIARIRGPVGLNIGARSPPEIALAILGEIIQTRRLPRATA